MVQLVNSDGKIVCHGSISKNEIQSLIRDKLFSQIRTWDYEDKRINFYANEIKECFVHLSLYDKDYILLKEQIKGMPFELLSNQELLAHFLKNAYVKVRKNSKSSDEDCSIEFFQRGSGGSDDWQGPLIIGSSVVIGCAIIFACLYRSYTMMIASELKLKEAQKQEQQAQLEAEADILEALRRVDNAKAHRNENTPLKPFIDNSKKQNDV